jgi:formylglycine-generating enzyme required for sulfatase activity
MGRTTPVGIYVQDATPEGVQDLAGNVWEWCFRDYSDWGHSQPGDQASSVLRGGAFLSSRGFARSDFRFDVTAHYGESPYGFRLACASPIGSTPDRTLRGRTQRRHGEAKQRAYSPRDGV